MRDIVGAVKFQRGMKCDFYEEVSPKQAFRLATAMRRMHPRGMPHRLIAELNVQLKRTE